VLVWLKLKNEDMKMEMMKDEMKVEAPAEEMKEEKVAGQFDEMKVIEGVDVDLIDRASAVMANEETEDEEAYKAELKSVIDDLKTAKDMAKETSAKEAFKAYDEVIKTLEEFAGALGSMEEDIALRGGKKVAELS
jgi:hypothetical protein